MTGGLFAYTPTSAVAFDSQNLSNRINLYLEKQKPDKKTTLLKTLSKQLPILQARMVEVGNIDRAYLFEYVRRHLPGAMMIDTADLIDDDNRGVTWTHAPR
jgi:3-mercaptopyruvate sulfurtransferase SseA